MGIDFPTALGIAAAAALCIFAAALAYDPGGTADPAPLKDSSVKDGEMLLALYETAEMYRNGGQDAKAGEQEEMFQNKVAEVASRLLDVEVSSVYADLFFPRPSGSDKASGTDLRFGRRHTGSPREGARRGAVRNVHGKIFNIPDRDAPERRAAIWISLRIRGDVWGWAVCLHILPRGSMYGRGDRLGRLPADMPRRRKRLFLQHDKPRRHQREPETGGLLRDTDRPVAPVTL